MTRVEQLNRLNLTQAERQVFASLIHDFLTGYIVSADQLTANIRLAKSSWDQGVDHTATKSPYEEALSVLGLAGSPSLNEIKIAYRRLSLLHHPDRGGNAETMKKINLAYELIMREAGEWKT